MISVTETAIQHIKSLMADPSNLDKALRVYVEKGGCSGMQYGMTFDSLKPDDFVFDQEGVKVLVDPSSDSFLKDSVLDYVDSLADTGFKIQNPIAKRSCGCGKSFEA
ncbi:MAG: iron-sulfur cluster assembly accessory protein [Verrucomicrobiota bacterium]|nr:iron-sulfur cluster assembly accessory protein [Verrucomicrobiota bacterium]